MRRFARSRRVACETVWAEPYNDRQNWRHVRAGYTAGSDGYRWISEVYESGNLTEWSRYATDLYVALRLRAEAEGWLNKLKYLLYERGIVGAHARAYCDRRGLMLQSPSDPDGRSHNPHIRAVQGMIGGPTAWNRVDSSYTLLEGE